MSDLPFKEHTQDKLDALQFYYNQWFKIVKGQKCYIIDCNAGTGYNYIKDKKVLGSALIVVELFKSDTDRNLTLYLIEKDMGNFKLLQQNIKNYIKNNKVPVNLESDIKFYEKNWSKVIKEIISNTHDGIRLFFLDPTAIKTIPWKKISSLIKNGKSEFGYKESGIELLVNWAWHAIRRKLGKYYALKTKSISNTDKSVYGELGNLDNFFGPMNWEEIANKYPNDIFNLKKRKKMIDKIQDLRNELVINYVKPFFKYFRYIKIHPIYHHKKTKQKFFAKRGMVKYFIIFATNYEPALDIIDVKFREQQDTKVYLDLPKNQKTLSEYLDIKIERKTIKNSIKLTINDKINNLELDLGIRFFKKTKDIIKYLYSRKNYDYGTFDFDIFNRFDINESKYLPFLIENKIIEVRLKKAKNGLFTGNFYYLCHPRLVDRKNYIFFNDKKYIFENGQLIEF